nr:phospholipase-like protein [Tanacetum cinerariifolium]
MGSYFTELEVLRSSPHIGNHAICYLLMIEYHARVHVKSKLHYFPLTKDRLGSAVDDVFLRMVEDLEDWNDFPWEEHMWQELYAAIRNVNSNHKQAHHKALEINPNFVPTYSLSGFVLCFKIWILESSNVTDRWWTKDSEGISRGCFWLLLKKDLNQKHKDSTSANKDAVNNLVDALDDLVDEDEFLKAQKLEAEKNRVAEQKRLRLQLMLKEANSRKSIDFSKSTHMKVAIDRCGTNKRRYVDVLKPTIEEDTSEKVFSMDRLKSKIMCLMNL